MQGITATIKVGDSGPAVANLQNTLALLIKRNLIRSREPLNQPAAGEVASLAKQLQERSRLAFGGATQQSVRYLQVQQGLATSY